jgi:chemotaxis protein MotB
MKKNREAVIRIVVRKKKHGSEAHGGAWKVAFADFMTGMFSLFLVLWLVTQSTDIKSAIAGYFQDPLGRANEFGSSIVPGDGAPTTPRLRTQKDVINLRKQMLDAVAQEIQEEVAQSPELSEVRKYVDVQITDEGLRIELLEDSSGVFFQLAASTPSSRGETILAMLGRELGTLPFPVKIEGHTDAYPFRGQGIYTNWELSTDRANAARRIMRENGLRSTQVTEVTGLAERMPRDAKNPYAPENRRITITMLLNAESLARNDSLITAKSGQEHR